MKNQLFTSDSDKKTRALARELSSHLLTGDIVGLRGDLGSGKTTFVQGLAEGLQIVDGFRVSSPTFTLVNEYRCTGTILYHMDFYRLENAWESETLGLETYFESRGICVIEWFERARNCLPKDFLEISFRWTGNDNRELHFSAHGERSQALLAQLPRENKF